MQSVVVFLTGKARATDREEAFGVHDDDRGVLEDDRLRPDPDAFGAGHGRGPDGEAGHAVEQVEALGEVMSAVSERTPQ